MEPWSPFNTEGTTLNQGDPMDTPTTAGAEEAEKMWSKVFSSSVDLFNLII